MSFIRKVEETGWYPQALSEVRVMIPVVCFGSEWFAGFDLETRKGFAGWVEEGGGGRVYT